MWSTSLFFSSRLIINIIFSFTNNYSLHQQFVIFFVKQFVSLTLFLNFYVFDTVQLIFIEIVYTILSRVNLTTYINTKLIAINDESKKSNIQDLNY